MSFAKDENDNTKRNVINNVFIDVPILVVNRDFISSEDIRWEIH